MSEKEVIRQAEELERIERKASEVSEKIRCIETDLVFVYRLIMRLENEYQKYYNIRYSEENYSRRKKEIEKLFLQSRDNLVQLIELVVGTFF